MVIPTITFTPITVLVQNICLNFGFCTKKKEQKYFIDKRILIVMQLLDTKLYWILKIMAYLWCKPR